MRSKAAAQMRCKDGQKQPVRSGGLWLGPGGHERPLHGHETQKRSVRAAGSLGEAQRAGLGLPLPTADVSYLVAQLGGRLSGGVIAPLTGAGRPTDDSRRLHRACHRAVGGSECH